MSVPAGTPGTGAMLARLVGLGARCGFTAEAVLLHVIDGAPLPIAAETRPITVSEEMHEAMPKAKTFADIVLGMETETGREKRQRIADLYGSTALKHPAIAARVGSTRQSVSFFVRQFRSAKDPRIIAGDRRRGIMNTEAPASSEAPMAVDGVGEDCSTELLSQSDDILPAGSNGEGRRADLVPDVSPEGAKEECAERDAGTQFPGETVAAIPAPPAVQEDVPEKGMVGPPETTLEAPEPADAAARPAGPGEDPAGPGNHIGDVTDMVAAADEVVGGDPGPAAPHHAERPGDEGIDSESTLTGGERAAGEEAGPNPSAEPASSTPSPAARRALHENLFDLYGSTGRTQREIGAELAIPEHKVSGLLKTARLDRDPRVLKGDAARAEAKAQRLAAEKQARENARQQQPERPTASDEIERLWRDTLLKPAEIAGRIGKPLTFVTAILSQKRKKRKPAVVAGDEARLAAEAERLELMDAPADAATGPEPEKPAPVDASPSDPPRADLVPTQPDDLVLLGTEQVLAIDRGWIVGSAGSTKGFPLINAVLMALAAGEIVDAGVVARKSGMRSAEAVQAVLSHWKADLAAIGIELVRVGSSDVRLRRA